MENSFQIREGSIADAAEIASIVRALGWFPFYEQETVEKSIKRIEQYISMLLESSNHDVLVAVNKNQKVIGYVVVGWQPFLCFKGCEGYVSELFVHENFRSAGVGKALLSEVQNIGKSKQCFRLMLLNKKDKESYQRGFYGKAGWLEREDIANFILPF